jgi:hypothetical protein
MKKTCFHCTFLFIALLFCFSGCASDSSSTQSSGSATAKPETSYTTQSFKNYPDHRFNYKAYARGMTKWGHNTLGWQAPDSDLTRYSGVLLKDFGGRLLPVQNKFSYTPHIKTFNLSLSQALKLPRETGPDALRIEGAVVECNPGSRAARMWVGFGAGKAGVSAVCEVYEPGRTDPSIRIYGRDTASYGAWGGDSAGLLNHLFNQVAVRMAAALEARIGK